MTLEEDLTTLANALGAPPNELIAYAAEDELGGYHSDPKHCTFPQGSLWGVEGQVLYALCRWMRPAHVVEVGTFRGASATHILTALEKNGEGHLTTIDVSGGGDLIPSHLRKRCTLLTGRGQDKIPYLHEAHLVFEDASHGTDDIEAILRASVKHLLQVTEVGRPKIVLSHDADHALVGEDVRAGWRRVFDDNFNILRSMPSDCGFAYKVL